MKFVIVEDNIMDVELVKRHLTAAFPGATFATASGVDDAKPLLAEPFAMGLVDFNLEDGSALDLLKSFKGEVQGPLFVMSSGLDEGVDQSLAKLGLYGFVSKANLNPSLLKHLYHFGCTQHQSQLELKHLAYTNHITGLLNVNGFYQAIDKATRHLGKQQALNVVHLRIDHFDALQQAYSVTGCNQVICDVAREVERLAPKDSLLCYDASGGFYVASKQVDKHLKALEKALSTLEAPAYGDGAILQFTAGIASYPADGNIGDVLCLAAKAAAVRARSRGLKFLAHDGALLAERERSAELIRELSGSFATSEFELLYQPQYDEHGGVAGAESLLRWHSMVLGNVSPAEFIPVAEQAGLIGIICRYVVDQVSKDIPQMMAQGFSPDFRVGINFGPTELVNPDLLKLLLALPADIAEHITLEITETAPLAQSCDRLTLQDATVRLKGHGFKIALDDFGMGYSSLDNLSLLQPDYIKVDRSMVMGIDTAIDNRKLIHVFEAASQHLSVGVVFEGVERQQERDVLDSYSGFSQRLYQGYLYSKPVSIRELLVEVKP